tara:strand:- start:13905 stop:14621 length:717 start_codon:yes stop_codon:yes gene_type:complete
MSDDEDKRADSGHDRHMKLPSPVRIARLHTALLTGLVVVVLVTVLSPQSLRWPLRIAFGWDAAVIVYLTINALRLIQTRSTDQIRRRAAALDDAGHAVLPLSLLAATASVAIVIGEAARAPHAAAVGTAILSLATVGLSWTFVHLIFAQHYAHGFYGPAETGKGDAGGLDFPGETEPDYWDFIHFALIIGVACQTADIKITSRRLRRISTVHSAVAFVFNTVILALGVNFAISLMSGG